MESGDEAATKWKRVALAEFGMQPGEGLNTDMKAVRKDYFLDHDHSAYVDQWDWERAITAEDRNLDFLTDVVKKIWKVLYGAGKYAEQEFPALKGKYPEIPEELTFLHAEEILEMFPDLPRKQRETQVLQEYPAVFIYGIGWPLADACGGLRRLGYRNHVERRASDAWAERRHPSMESGDEAATRTHVDGSPRERRDAEEAAGDVRSTRQPEAPVPPSDRQRRRAAQHRRRYRTVAHLHVPASQGAPRRGQRHCVAAGPQGHVRGAAHPRSGVERVRR
jgi:hypothetical protein